MTRTHDIPHLRRACQVQIKKYVCLRSPDRPYFSGADPNLFYRHLFDPINFYTEFG